MRKADFSWAASRARVVAQDTGKPEWQELPERLELRFGGFHLGAPADSDSQRSRLDSLCTWLEDSSSSAQKAQAVLAEVSKLESHSSGKPQLPCWADFRDVGLEDSEFARLLHCLGSGLRLERLWLSVNKLGPRSQEVLLELIAAVGVDLEELHLVETGLNDDNVFELLSGLATARASQARAKQEMEMSCLVFLAGNHIDAPALLERLKRAEISVSLDDCQKTEAASSELLLPDFCHCAPLFRETSGAQDRLLEALVCLTEALGEAIAPLAGEMAKAELEDTGMEVEAQAVEPRSPTKSHPGSSARTSASSGTGAVADAISSLRNLLVKASSGSTQEQTPVPQEQSEEREEAAQREWYKKHMEAACPSPHTPPLGEPFGTSKYPPPAPSQHLHEAMVQDKMPTAQGLQNVAQTPFPLPGTSLSHGFASPGNPPFSTSDQQVVTALRAAVSNFLPELAKPPAVAPSPAVPAFPPPPPVMLPSHLQSLQAASFEALGTPPGALSNLKPAVTAGHNFQAFQASAGPGNTSGPGANSILAGYEDALLGPEGGSLNDEEMDLGEPAPWKAQRRRLRRRVGDR